MPLDFLFDEVLRYESLQTSCFDWTVIAVLAKDSVDKCHLFYKQLHQKS